VSAGVAEPLVRDGGALVFTTGGNAQFCVTPGCRPQRDLAKPQREPPGISQGAGRPAQPMLRFRLIGVTFVTTES
jgi:hypothetical protein